MMGISLPTTTTKPKTDLNKFKIFLYGSPKIGKSTFASQFEKPLFIATEAGLTALETYQVPVTKWEDYIEVLKALGSQPHDYKTIVIDTVDNLAKMCSDYICRVNNITHESDLGYGKGFVMAQDTFLKPLSWLSHQDVGLVMISHEKNEVVKSRTSEVSKSMPTLTGGYRKIALGLADLILYAHMVERANEKGEIEQVRVLRTKPSETWEAGDRTGKLPAALPFEYKYFAEKWEELNHE